MFESINKLLDEHDEFNMNDEISTEVYDLSEALNENDFDNDISKDTNDVNINDVDEMEDDDLGIDEENFDVENESDFEDEDDEDDFVSEIIEEELDNIMLNNMSTIDEDLDKLFDEACNKSTCEDDDFDIMDDDDDDSDIDGVEMDDIDLGLNF